LHALSVDLSANAAGAADKANELAGLFRAQLDLLRSSAEKISPAELAAGVKAVRDSLTQYETGLVAIRSHNDDFRSELQSVLGSDGPKTLNLLREALVDVDVHIEALATSHRISTPDTINIDAAILRSMKQCIGIMQERSTQFAIWANSSRENIDTLRARLR
jgi:hypothetical protein